MGVAVRTSLFPFVGIAGRSTLGGGSCMRLDLPARNKGGVVVGSGVRSGELFAASFYIVCCRVL